MTRAANTRSGGKAKVARLAWLQPFLRRPGQTILCATFAGLLVGIMANALFLQTARHPAPIFGPPLPTRPLAAAPAPVAKAAPADFAAAAQPPAFVPVPPPRPADFSVAAREAEVQKDQIGSLLKGAAAPAPETTRLVASAQRALAKLNYPVKADGVMGATTRQSIEKFELSRKLPITGDLTPRTLRELSAQSGLPVN